MVRLAYYIRKKSTHCIWTQKVKSLFFCQVQFLSAQNTIRPAAIPLTTELRFIEAPLKFKFSTDFHWNIERSQFGVYIYISASDEIVEHLVSILIERKKFNILSWGENIDPAWKNEFSWSVRLSPD